MRIYIYTLDSHDCYGPFWTVKEAHLFAVDFGLTSYQLLSEPPYGATTSLMREAGSEDRG